MFRFVLIDSYRSLHLYHSAKSGGTFFTYGDWYWQYDQSKSEIKTFADCVYLGVL